MEDLFKDYNSRARPVHNVTKAVQLVFDIALKQILDVVSIFKKSLTIIICKLYL